MKNPSGWYKYRDTLQHYFDNDMKHSICGTIRKTAWIYEVRGEKKGRCKHCVRMVSK